MVKENTKVRGDLVFDADKCIGCGSCALICPNDAIEILKRKRTGSIYYSHAYCLYCRRCAFVCPQGAIKYSGVIENDSGDGSEKSLSEEKLDFAYQVCPSCGSEFTPVPLMQKILETFGNGRGEITSIIKLCPDCRSRELFQRTMGYGKID